MLFKNILKFHACRCFPITDINECASNPCVSGRGSCINGLDQWECDCNQPYYGDTCQRGTNITCSRVNKNVAIISATTQYKEKSK